MLLVYRKMSAFADHESRTKARERVLNLRETQEGYKESYRCRKDRTPGKSVLRERGSMRRDREWHLQNAKRFLDRLSTEQKLLIVSGSMEERLEAGLPAFEAFGEAAHGVQARHDQSFDLGTPVNTTVFQNPVGFAATWDKELMRNVGRVVGTEARSLYNDNLHNALCMLAPTVDMERDPRWGRNEEAYGEDPHLTSRMAGEYIRGMAGDDPDYVMCGATLKHFYGNNTEDMRSLADSNISDELKDTYYIHVFEEVIDYADPMAVMSSYNYVNGVPNTFNPELRTRLKARGLPYVSGDGGVIGLSIRLQHEANDMADALLKAIHAGMDAFPEDKNQIREALVELLDSGRLTEEELDEVVLNRLLVFSLLGLLTPARDAFPREVYNASRVDTGESRALARQASSEAAVLLKNRENALPLADEDKVLLLGPFIDRCPMDWYSGVTSKQVTLKDGMKDHLAGSEELFPYVRIRLADGSYAGVEKDRIVPVAKEEAETFRIMLWDDSRFTIRAMSNGKLLTTHAPEEKIINSEIPEEKFVLYAYRDEAFSWFVQEAFRMIDGQGEEIFFTEENALHFWEDARIAGIRNHDGETRLTFETVTTAEELLQKAAEAAGDCRVIASFGLHPIVNGKEEWDRTSIQLPSFQRAVLRLIRESFPEVILLLHTNSPVAILEEAEDDRVKAILWMATGSEEYGNSLQDVFFGRVSPAGCLCQTWYRDDGQLPAITDYDIKTNKVTYLYLEDEPLFRFGYGLSYTTFQKEIVGTEAGRVSVRVKNTGDCISDTVVQVYKRPEGYSLWEDCSMAGGRLAAFTRLKDLKPGEERQIDLEVRY